MQEVRLRNGSKVAAFLVTVTMVSLNRLLETNPIAFYELIMKCTDSNHQLFGKNGDDLKTLGLVDRDGNVHQAIRNIVLSATVCEGLELKLISPIAP